ncbi:MAG: hypothetical protein U5K76_03475 [Woeseiaceae bacterium]|nr:hypothetical protein [Woeseiaceae bacterium]
MLVLVSLAFMQLATATHQFDRPADVAFDAWWHPLVAGSPASICFRLPPRAPTVDCSPVAVAAVAVADVIPAIAALPVRQRGPPHA